MTPALDPGAPTRNAPRDTSSVAPRLAAVLVVALVAVALGGLLLSERLAERRVRTLAATSLRLRVESLADEVERALLLRRGAVPPGEPVVDAPPSALPQGAPETDAMGRALDPSLALPPRIARRLAGRVAARLPDPVALVTPEGEIAAWLRPPAAAAPLPPLDTPLILATGVTVVETDPDAPGGTFALVPLVGPDGIVSGGLLVQPLARSLDAELAPTRAAYRSARRVVVAVALLVALALAVGLTLWIVRPLRRITRGVTAIGGGAYATRLAETAPGEIGRLARTVNAMAAEVEAAVEALRGTDARRRELVANVGHDVRTPLAALRAYVEEATRHIDGGREADARAALAGATRQAEQATRLVADLFELSALDSDAADALRVEAVPIGELVADVAAQHRPLLAGGGIAFTVETAPALPVVEADGVRLVRLLSNLLANAREHTPEGGSVALRARVVDGWVEITVEDTGSGLSAEALAHVFERYWRGADARTRRSAGGGTGLGLAIAASIARRHGGTLSAENAPTGGARFTFRMPVGDEGRWATDDEPRDANVG